MDYIEVWGSADALCGLRRKIRPYLERWKDMCFKTDSEKGGSTVIVIKNNEAVSAILEEGIARLKEVAAHEYTQDC